MIFFILYETLTQAYSKGSFNTFAYKSGDIRDFLCNICFAAISSSVLDSFVITVNWIKLNYLLDSTVDQEIVCDK